MALNRKKLVVNIVFYAVIALIYIFVIVMIIAKFNNGTVYIFNTRYDVVLTDSMSEKNPEHADFLKGTTQIQKMDLVQSRKIDDDTTLNVKDVVLFKSPELKNETVMHRIVEIQNYYNTITINDSELGNLDGINGINLSNEKSCILFSAISLKTIEFEFVSNNQYNDDFSLVVENQFVNLTVETEVVGNHYKHVVHYDNEPKYPSDIRIFKGLPNGNYITNIKYTSNTSEVFTLSADEYSRPAEGDYQKQFLIRQTYRLRGDKAKDFDNGGAFFERSSLYSKVDNVIPKAGIFIRFISSIPGIIMLIGIAFIITFASYLYNRDKKPKEAIPAIAEPIENDPTENKTIENPEPEKEEPREEDKNENENG